MSPEEFDLLEAHHHFSTYCFNKAWDLIEKFDRTPDEDEEMIQLSLASTWHWSRREDSTGRTTSIGYWQTSRVYAILGQIENARRYGELCLAVSQKDDIPPFFLGYAYEALARAEALASNREALQGYIDLAKETAELVSDLDEKKMLLDDLETIL